MKKILLSAIASCCFLIAASQSSRTYFAGETISGIQIHGDCEVMLSQGNDTGATIELPDSPDYKFECRMRPGNILYLEYRYDWEKMQAEAKKKKKGRWWLETASRTTPRLKARITINRPENITATNDCSIECQGSFAASECTLALTNDAVIDGLDLKTGKLTLQGSNDAIFRNLSISATEKAVLNTVNDALISNLSLSAPTLRINLSNDAEINGSRFRATESATINAANDAIFSNTVDSPHLSVTATNDALISASGSAERATVQIANDASADLSGIPLRELECSLQQDSRLRCRVSETLTVRFSHRDSRLEYSGSPRLNLLQSNGTIRKIE